MTSCPGWDGISYKCLSKLWEHIRVPLRNMANESFSNGILSSTLRTGLIKLIPKGKNNTRVEDWRPITLLPTSYKVISGVVANRLEQTLPYIIGRAQKGFLKYKNMGTVLHNVIDGIADSWAEGEQMGILLVDFVKAFDSVEHEFIRKAMQHFNLGDVLVGMVMTLLKDRKACINLGNMYSRTLNIDRGTPQGDRSSPYIFVICVEILLIKLELGDNRCIIGRGGINKAGEEVNSVGEAFADDLTALFRFTSVAAKKIMQILENYGTLCGLCINREKTHIMIVGKEWEGEDRIEGIAIKKECRLLGVMVDDKVSNLRVNWTNCISKISGLINYWNQYNLTLTGRVLVAKTFLMSQVTFLLGIIPIESDIAKRIEGMIERYTLGNLQIAKDRIYNKIEQGGTGLLRISELNTAMKCAWVNRWKREGANVDITGSIVLNTAGRGGIECIDKEKIHRNNRPCARGIADAWHEFRGKMYENDGNMYCARVFANPGIRNRMGEMLGGGNIFGWAKYEEVKRTISNVKFGDICGEECILPKEELIGKLGIELNDREYGKIKTAIRYVRNKFKPRWELRMVGKSINEWIHPIKKGSSKFRKIMSGRGSRVYSSFSFESIRPINTMWAQLGIGLDPGIVGCSMLLWKIGEADAELRQFMFRWNQGMVHGNTVISHFGDVDRKCTFCKCKAISVMKNVLGRDPTQAEREGIIVMDEDRPHIFWACPHVQECIQAVHKNIWGNNNPVEKKTFLMGRDMGCIEATLLYMLVNMYIKQRIWKYKLATVLPNINNITNDVFRWLAGITVYNKWRIMLPLVRQRTRF